MMLIINQVDYTDSQYHHSQTAMHLYYLGLPVHFRSLHQIILSVHLEVVQSAQCSPYTEIAFQASGSHLFESLRQLLLSEVLALFPHLTVKHRYCIPEQKYSLLIRLN